MKKDAKLSPCGTYRYSLTREWDTALPRVCFAMLNPSTADADNDDPTIRRCIAFAKSWGFGSLEVVNLSPFRATDPKELKGVVDTFDVGMYNYVSVKLAAERASLIVAAWGANPLTLEGGPRLCELIHSVGKDVHCIAKTKSGRPQHPLYIPGDAKPMLYAAKSNDANNENNEVSNGNTTASKQHI